MTSIEFMVFGRAATAGNKTAFPFKRKDGSLGVRVTEGRRPGAREHAAAWRVAVQTAGAHAMSGAGLFAGPLELRIQIVRMRPKSHYGASGALKASAPVYPTTRPDLTKYERAIEDALTGIVWCDDSQVVRKHTGKLYGDSDRTTVTVTLIDSGQTPAQPSATASESSSGGGAVRLGTPGGLVTGLAGLTNSAACPQTAQDALQEALGWNDPEVKLGKINAPAGSPRSAKASEQA